MPELPGFIELVTNIYTSLGESWDHYPAEAEGMKCPDRFKAPDRTLNALAERMGDGGDAVRSELTKALSTNLDKSKFHYDLMRLSRSVKDHRIVTTNFDTLFERSWKFFQGIDIESHCTAGMPGPGSTRWKGVFHLHGRIRDPKTPRLTESELVLTSAEFGDAYLRSGWASRYLYDLLRHSHVVIVGYSLNDPPTRYLFDALAADRKRFEFKNLYAIVADEDNADELIEVWKGRQAIPLLYKAPRDRRTKKRDYSALRATIEGWADYADDPTSWAKLRLRALFRQSTSALIETDWQALDWILGRRDNDRLLEEANPTSRWLEVLLERSEKREHPLEYGYWIAKRLSEREMIDAVLRNQSVLTRRSRNIIEFEVLRSSTLSETRRTFWLALCDSKRQSESSLTDSHYRLSRILKLGDTNGYARSLIAEVFTPIAKFGYRYSSGSRRSGQTVQQVASIDFELGDTFVRAGDVFKSWPPNDDLALLTDLISSLKEHLRRRQSLVPRPVSSVWIVASIKDHPQNFDSGNLSQIIRLIANILERLANTDPGAARAASVAWQLSTDQWEIRLWLHALSLANVHQASLAASFLINASDDVFWSANYQREVMQLLIERWTEFSIDDRAAIEARLMQGNER
uniref:SIR2 family protein n=1 Tax=Altererythrobacter segetis TaxID=1104773 RepID=UPI00140815EB|nr:SIR2 family protein [Altererythrobacter segetis]